MDTAQIRHNILRLAKRYALPLRSDALLRRYYRSGGDMLWVSYNGVNAAVDTLRTFMEEASQEGLGGVVAHGEVLQASVEAFSRLDTLRFDSDINDLLARVEYHATSAYLRYIEAEHFGLINPNDILNRLDTLEVDSLSKVHYRRLADIKLLRLDSAFCATALQRINNDSIGAFLRRMPPRTPLFAALRRRLERGGLSAYDRSQTLLNMERCRWRTKDTPKSGERYVQVNIPSYTLMAVKGNGETLFMRIGCGKTDTKTPLLTSRIYRMEINPAWIIPRSIAKGIVHSLGYLHKNDIWVVEDGKRLPPEMASWEKIMSSKQYLRQESGKENPLGNIIFRFDNSCSVFLHHTSAPWVLQARKRAVSHGCIRVEKPEELADFLLFEDRSLRERVRYSMVHGLDEDKGKLDRKKMIHSAKVPDVPLQIAYYTVYFDGSGNLQAFDDVYSYDEIMWQALQRFVH